MLTAYRGPDAIRRDLADRIAASLALFAPGQSLVHRDHDAIHAWLPGALDATSPGKGSRSSRTGASRWQPQLSPRGNPVLFKGWFDNLTEIASQLGLASRHPAAVYGAAVDAWGDDADRRLIGNYCAIIDDRADHRLRLSRSPLRAPPLHYFTDGDHVGAASVPRVLHVMGLPSRLNLRKLADNLYFNLTEDESFYENAWRVEIGEIVHLGAGLRKQVRYYDPMAIAPLPRTDVRELVEETDRLLTEASRMAIAGSRQPAVQLSGGLDSANVASRILRCLPESQRLKSFTFTPLANWQEPDSEFLFANERPKVEAFAAMHPRLDAYFTDNPHGDYETRLDAMHLAMGTGQASLAVASDYHGLFTLAREQGCDVMLSSDMGNATFSNCGDWGYGEFLWQGKWRQLYRALRAVRSDPRPMWRKVITRAVIPSLSDPLWKRWQAFRGRNVVPQNRDIALLRPEALARFDVEARARAAGVCFERGDAGSRRVLVRNQFARGDIESGDVLQGFEQLYGIATRDVPSYRPLVEFCLGLPTDIFMRDGQTRWLARQLSQGHLPAEQCTDNRWGFQGADWHARLTPKLPEIRAELARARAIPELNELIDFEKIDKALDDWPSASQPYHRDFQLYAYAIPRVLTTARFYRFASGSNQG